MTRARRLVSTALCAALVCARSAQAANYAVPPPGYQPDVSTDEAGLWMEVDKMEAQVKTSPALIKDTALNAYVKGIVCKLAGPQCASIRVYIMEVPQFNAYMMPNGAMVVWSGALLRMDNEAQLSFVLAHELTHYLHRHTLEHYREVVNTTNALAIFGLVTAGAGFGLVGLLANVAALGTLFANSRDQERDADAGGFEAGTINGYDPRQAAEIWRFIADEQNANPRREKKFFTADHPAPEERLATMEKRATEIAAQRGDWATNEPAYRAAIRPFAERWVSDEFSRGQPEESVMLFERLAAREPSWGLMRYALGEAYRKRNARDDVARASEAYQAAIGCPDAPAVAYRGLGLVAMKDGRNGEARDAFTQYLARSPAADDKAMIDFYLTQL